MDAILKLLPTHPGFLPKWLFFVGVVSIANSLQSYATLEYTQRVYEGPEPESPKDDTPAAKPVEVESPVTPLSARTFGTWTFLSGLIRLYAAYNVDSIHMYRMAFLTYVVAWGHFAMEWVVFGTARWGKGLAGPVIVSSGTIAWMAMQSKFYVG